MGYLIFKCQRTIKLVKAVNQNEVEFRSSVGNHSFSSYGHFLTDKFNAQLKEKEDTAEPQVSRPSVTFWKPPSLIATPNATEDKYQTNYPSLPLIETKQTSETARIGGIGHNADLELDLYAYDTSSIKYNQKSNEFYLSSRQ